jgi:hypothetical protein
MLDYTLNKMLEEHQIVIERDTAAVDDFGAESSRGWVELGTIDALFYWWPSHGEGAFDEHGDPQRNVNTTGGGVLVPLGTDVTEEDRVARVLLKGGTEVQGPFRITSLRETETHIELSIERP